MPVIMTGSDAANFAEKLSRQASARHAEEYISQMQRECELASRLIRALLRHVHASDRLVLPDA